MTLLYTYNCYYKAFIFILVKQHEKNTKRNYTKCLVVKGRFN